jgi:hypothetical protein
MRITSAGRLLLGETTSDTDLGGYIQVVGDNYGESSILQARTSANQYGPSLDFLKSRNATWGSHTIVQDGDQLGTIQFRGDDGVNYSGGAASIKGEVDGTPGANDLPGRLVFSTSSDGSDSASERLRVGSAGQIGIGGANYGTDGQVLTSTGASSAPAWEDAGGGGFSNFAVLTSGSGASWSVPAGVKSVKVICIGGGGGGGKSEDGSEAGGGGGAGGTVIHYFDTSGGGTATYTVGGGGAGGSSMGSAAPSGTDSTFAYSSTTLTGEGGSGGYGNQNGSYPNGGGPGGVGSGGDLNLIGGAGAAGFRYAGGNNETVGGGIGGCSFLGGSTAPKGQTSGQRTAVSNTGSGGVGGVDGNGGAGSSGIIVIEY